jgi:hypothetical protein
MKYNLEALPAWVGLTLETGFLEVEYQGFQYLVQKKPGFLDRRKTRCGYKSYFFFTPLARYLNMYQNQHKSEYHHYFDFEFFHLLNHAYLITFLLQVWH